MIAKKELVADVLNAQLRELHFRDKPDVEEGQVVPLQASAVSRAVCYLRVNEVVAEGDLWVVRFHRVGQPDRPRFLAADSSRGYTSDPGRAMPAEPEPVPEGWQQLITEDRESHAHRQWLKLQPQLTKLSFSVRLRLVARVAEQRRMRVGGELYKIRKDKNRGLAMAALKKLEEKVHKR